MTLSSSPGKVTELPDTQGHFLWDVAAEPSPGKGGAGGMGWEPSAGSSLRSGGGAGPWRLRGPWAFHCPCRYVGSAWGLGWGWGRTQVPEVCRQLPIPSPLTAPAF